MPPDHVVNIYHEPAAMAQAVAAWAAIPLRRGGGAIFVCTPAHAALARDELRALGIDVDACEREGRLRIEDADTLLPRFMGEEGPEGERLRPLAAGLLDDVRRACGDGPLRVWGEMVDILVKRGNIAGAHTLEKHWNDLLAGTDVQLLCSYEIDALDPDAQARVLLDVCTTHTDLVPEEGAALDAGVTAALTEVFGAQKAAELRGTLPRRKELLDVMQPASAIILSLREMDPALGADIAERARAHVARRTHAAR